jgi:hypothetical protein
LENPSLIGASELSSRLHSGFSVLTTLLFALLAEGLADFGGSACATLSISSAWFWYSVDQTYRSQFQLPRLGGHCTHSPGKTHALFPITQVALSPIVNRSDLSQNSFYRNRNPDKV